MKYTVVNDYGKPYEAVRYYLNNEDDLLDLKGRLNDLIEHEEVIGACGYNVVITDWFVEDGYFFIGALETDYFEDYTDQEKYLDYLMYNNKCKIGGLTNEVSLLCKWKYQSYRF